VKKLLTILSVFLFLFGVLLLTSPLWGRIIIKYALEKTFGGSVKCGDVRFVFPNKIYAGDLSIGNRIFLANVGVSVENVLKLSPINLELTKPKIIIIHNEKGEWVFPEIPGLGNISGGTSTSTINIEIRAKVKEGVVIVRDIKTKKETNVSNVSGEFNYKNQVISYTATSTSSKETLSSQGTYNFSESSGVLNFSFKNAKAKDWAHLFLPDLFVTEDGTFTGSLSIAGKGAEWYVNGNLSIQDTTISLKDFNLSIKKITANIVIDKNNIILKNGQGYWETSEINLSGRFTPDLLLDLNIKNLDISNIDEKYLSNNFGLKGIGNGSFKIEGKYETPSILGKISVKNGEIFRLSFDTLDITSSSTLPNLNLDLSALFLGGKMTGKLTYNMDKQKGELLLNGENIPIQNIAKSFNLPPIEGIANFSLKGSGEKTWKLLLTGTLQNGKLGEYSAEKVDFSVEGESDLNFFFLKEVNIKGSGINLYGYSFDLFLNLTYFFGNYKVSGKLITPFNPFFISGVCDPEFENANLKISIPNTLLQMENLNGNLFGEVRVKGNILKEPYIEASIAGRDIKYNGLSFERVNLFLSGNNLSQILIRSVSAKIGRNYLAGNGILNVAEKKIDLKGNIIIDSGVSIPLIFSVKGDMNDWKGEITSRNNFIKIGNIILNDFRGKLEFNNLGNIKGRFSSTSSGRIFDIEVLGENWKWRAFIYAKNLINELEELTLNINDDLSFNGILKAKYMGDIFSINILGTLKEENMNGEVTLIYGSFPIKAQFIFDLKNSLRLKDLCYEDISIGELDFDWKDENVYISGEILGGSIKGNYNLSNNSGAIYLIGLSINSLIKEINGKLDGEIILDKDIGFKINSEKLVFKGVNIGNLSILGTVNNGLHFEKIEFLLFDKLRLSSILSLNYFKYLDGFIKISYENSDLGIVNLGGEIDHISISGNIWEGEIKGEYYSNKLNIIGKNINLEKNNIVSGLKGIVKDLNIQFLPSEIVFNLSSDEINFTNLSIKNLSLDGIYKDKLSLNVKGELWEFLWQLRGEVQEDFLFDLKLSSSKYPMMDSLWKGSVDYKKMVVELESKETKIPKLIRGNILMNLKDKDLLKGTFNFEKDGNIKIDLDAQGKGTLVLRNVPLEMLRIINLPEISGIFGGIVNLASFAIKDGNLISVLNLFNLNRNLVINANIFQGNDGYLLNGTIRDMAMGVISGFIKGDNFDLSLKFDNTEFLTYIIPSQIAKNIEKGKVSIKIEGNLSKWNLEGNIDFSEPLEFVYIMQKVNSLGFGIEADGSNIKLEKLDIPFASSKVSGTGFIYPNLDVNLKIKNLVLNVPDLAKSYFDGDINISDLKSPIVKGDVTLYNAVLSIPKQETKGEETLLPKIRLSLNLNLGDNVVFYLPDMGLSLSLKGGVYVSGDLSKPLLLGKIDFSKGNINIVNRNFSIYSGYIKFLGLSYTENIWEIMAKTTIQNYVVYLTGYGFMGQSSINFTSDPPLSLKEILFLLLGQERLTFAKEETFPLYSFLENIPIGVQNIISSTLIEYLISPLFSEISRVLNLESIKVQYNLSYFIPTFSKITFEKKLSDNIIFRLDYSLEKGSFSGWELEYLLRSGLNIKWLNTEGVNFFSFQYGVKF